MKIKQCKYGDGNMVLIGVNECGEEFYAASVKVTSEDGGQLEERMMWEALRVIEDSIKAKALNEENGIYKDCWYWEDRRQTN